MVVQEQEEHDRLYAEAVEFCRQLIVIAGRAQHGLSSQEKRQLEDASALFRRVVEINNQNWSAMWHLGKIYQRLGNYQVALEHFASAHKVKPDQPDVAREAAITALQAGLPQDAVEYCKRAIENNPYDPGLKANLALAFLFSERPKEAQAVVIEALNENPDDQITERLAKLIKEVLDGKRPCPHHMRDLTGR